jgi:hypothetical protein
LNHKSYIILTNISLNCKNGINIRIQARWLISSTISKQKLARKE